MKSYIFCYALKYLNSFCIAKIIPFAQPYTVLVKGKTAKSCQQWCDWPCAHSYLRRKVFSLYLSLRYRLIDMVKLYITFLKAKPEEMLRIIPYHFFLTNQEIGESEFKSLFCPQRMKSHLWIGLMNALDMTW